MSKFKAKRKGNSDRWDLFSGKKYLGNFSLAGIPLVLAIRKRHKLHSAIELNNIKKLENSKQ